MPLETVQKIKKDGFFKPFDLIIYAVLLVLVAVLFLSSGIFAPKDELSGIDVVCQNKKVFTYVFNGDDYQIFDGEKIEILTDTPSELTLKFYTDKLKYKFNQIKIDKVKKSVKVVDATCSTRKDCVHTAEMTNSSQTIICVPHELIIAPTGKTPSDTDIIL
jgi:hypothetical protein